MTPPNVSKSTLFDLFLAVNKNRFVSKSLKNILSENNPISILVEGSGYPTNFDTLNALISKRNQPKDLILLVDIDPMIVTKHKQYIQKTFPYANYQVIQGDINALPIKKDAMDIIINNFTANFNVTNRDDDKTIAEIKRVLKQVKSVCIFSIGITNNEKGTISYSSGFGDTAVLNRTERYYESLFLLHNLVFKKFDTKGNESIFSYNRYILTHQ